MNQIKTNLGEQLFYDQYTHLALYKIKILMRKYGVTHHVFIKGIRTKKEITALFEAENINYKLIVEKDGYRFIFYIAKK